MTGELITLVADVLEIDESELTEDSGPGRVKQWDSLAHVAIVSAVEERFSIELAMTDIMDVKSVKDLSSLVARSLA